MSATVEQRKCNLTKANEVRIPRSRLKKRIATGEVTASSVLLSPSPEALTWRVGDMLMAQRRWGPQRMRRLLIGTGTAVSPPVPERKQIGALTEGQTRRILAGLAAR